MASQQSAGVLFADGFEEIEGLTSADILVRAGFKVDHVGVTGNSVTGAHGIKIQTALTIQEAAKKSYDVVVLPGGMPGASNLAENQEVIKLLKAQQTNGKWIAAICASPVVVLVKKSIMGDAKGVCYPAMEKDMGDYLITSKDDCHVDTQHKIITSKGPATAMSFGLCIVKHILGQSKAQEVADALLYKHSF